MRNPFRIRAAQRSVSDEQFVKLFGAGVFDLLGDLDNPWENLVFLRSAPGGGKTSFLRLLTPRPLKIAASMLQNDEHSRPTYDALRKSDALDEAEPKLLGVMVAFTTEYRELEEIDVGNGLFRALLNARIVIATMRAVLERSDRTYPEDLNTIQVRWCPDTDATIPAEATGQDLYEWASEIERGFYERLDELGEDDRPPSGHTRLDALTWFAQAEIIDIQGLISAKRVLMLDDLQLLSSTQRTSLTDLLANTRVSCGIWVAERLEALSHREMLSEGALQSRDYEGIIQLESRWARRPKPYAKFVSQVANLRARRADGFEDRDFFALLAEDDTSDHDSRFEDACREIEMRLKHVNDKGRYDDWLEAARRYPGGTVERARKWRATEILIDRDRARAQRSFDFELLPEHELDDRGSSSVDHAADLFLRKELDVPIYFGRDSLAAISSMNIDQYVEVAGDIFEELSAKVSGPRASPASLSAERQHVIIKQTALNRWNGLVRRLPTGHDARRFLEAVGAFCYEQTYRPTAPYAPGVTGIAVTMADRAILIDDTDEKPTPLHRLRDVLTSLVAQNLLSPRLDRRSKGRDCVVFYLNRLLCVHFDLPLGYGGWREKSLNDLNNWVSHGSLAIKEERLV